MLVPFLSILFMLLSVILTWEMHKHEEEKTAQLIEAGRAFFSQLIVARKWNAMHGGVYVEVTEDTKPNPFLDDAERDIRSTAGKLYTKINPAYMTRQMSDLARRWGNYTFHITSLRPINPANSPDPWERDSLLRFEEGARESYTYYSEHGRRVFRYMAPLPVERPCLKCHSQQGYSEGDIRGGISIDIPAAASDAIYEAETKRTIISYGIVGMASFLFITAIVWFFSRRMVAGISREIEHNRLRATIELAGATAHELRQPLTVITGFMELFLEKVERGEITTEEIRLLMSQCRRMDDIITRMLNITHYRTKDYSGGIRIFDLGSQGKDRAEEDNR